MQYRYDIQENHKNYSNILVIHKSCTFTVETILNQNGRRLA